MAVPATFLSFKERTACSSAWAGNVGFAGAFQNTQGRADLSQVLLPSSEDGVGLSACGTEARVQNRLHPDTEALFSP